MDLHSGQPCVQEHSRSAEPSYHMGRAGCGQSVMGTYGYFPLCKVGWCCNWSSWSNWLQLVQLVTPKRGK